ncbi:MAG: hypothetical protein HYY00_08625 [Chloroflexi bacterium]|nr:hypothetical protein [Chloroflexota bacterium]
MVVAPTGRELGGLRPSLDGTGLAAAVVGLGRQSADELRRLLPAHRPGALVSLGFAGGLDPALQCADLVICSRTAACNGGVPCPADARLLEVASALLKELSLPHRWDDLLTVPEVLLEPREKERAYSETGAAVVDLEGHWMAMEAQQAGVPFLSLRAVLDPQRERLPGLVREIVAAGGRGEFWRSLRYAALRQWQTPRLALLAWQSRRAASALRQVAMRLLPIMAEQLAQDGSH